MALNWLVQGCQPGDSLLFHYSGHGSRQRNSRGNEVDGYDETLCPLDFETQGMIVDDDINATIVRPLPLGVKLHAIRDAGHSGTILDLPFLCRMNRLVILKALILARSLFLHCTHIHHLFHILNTRINNNKNMDIACEIMNIMYTKCISTM